MFNKQAMSIVNIGTASLVEDLTKVGLDSSDQETKKICKVTPMTFDEDELVELELLRDEEIDVLVDRGLISSNNRWNPKYRKGFTLKCPKMALVITTGDGCPVKPLTYQITNINLPRVIIDQLRVKVRAIDEIDRRANTSEQWCRRHLSDNGCFQFEMAALHIIVETIAFLKYFRSDPTYWKNKTTLRRTDYELSFERRGILKSYYRLYSLLPDPDNNKDIYDPFNLDWSKKETDMTNERELALSEVRGKSEIENSMFGIDPSSVQGHDLVNSILGKTPEEVCDKIPESFRILHIESVVRRDLATKFLRRQAVIRKELETLPLNILKGCLKQETRLEMGKRANEPQMLVDHLVDPDLTFHCTREDLIPSIVRQGFLKPDGEKDIRCGATYGHSCSASASTLINN